MGFGILEGFGWLLVALLVRIVYQFVSIYLWEPYRIRRCMEKQGIRGPPIKFMIGNLLEIAKLRETEAQQDMNGLSHDIVKRVLPHYVKYSEIYGKQFLLWWGVEPRLAVFDPEMIKDILSSKYNHCYGRSIMQQKGNQDFIGKGLLMSNGSDWAHRRKIVGPAFQTDKLKAHVKYVVECASNMLNDIEMKMEKAQESYIEIEVSENLSKLAADIIARTEFGSCYDKGKRIFHQLNCLQKLSSQSGKYLWFPGSRYLPTRYNREIKSRKKEVEKDLMDIIQARRDSVKLGRGESYGNDLLGLMLAETHKESTTGKGLTNQELMDECKTFFFAGHETTALHMTWTVMLLASNPQWQERAREEAFQVCNGNPPSSSDLAKLRILGMIMKESMRLYTPATMLPRQTFKEVKVGEVKIPKGVSVWIPVVAIHHSKELWGEDADEFNPARFEDGASKACKHPMAFIPFSSGPRVCVGQGFAIMEVKVVLAMMLCRFRFKLSPDYRHSPISVLTIKPQHGVPIIFEPLP